MPGFNEIVFLIFVVLSFRQPGAGRAAGMIGRGGAGALEIGDLFRWCRASGRWCTALDVCSHGWRARVRRRLHLAAGDHLSGLAPLRG